MLRKVASRVNELTFRSSVAVSTASHNVLGFRRAGTGTSAMLVNLITGMFMMTAATGVALELGQALSTNSQTALTALQQMFGGGGG